MLDATEAAVAALHAAGDDTEALAEALEKAAFLMETPGDARQKFRAARTKLRNLNAAAQKQHEDKTGAAAAGRSPHIKEAYDPAEFEVLAEKYDKLNWRMISKPGGATIKPDDFYRLYALHMQVTRGDNNTERPMWAERGGLDFEGRARWDAWMAIKGLDRIKARARFVKLFYEFPPAFLYKDTRAAA